MGRRRWLLPVVLFFGSAQLAASVVRARAERHCDGPKGDCNTSFSFSQLAVASPLAPEDSCQDYGCAAFRPDERCQCHPRCLAEGHCCADFVEQCMPTIKAKSFVGMKVDWGVGLKFWTLAVGIFGIVAAGTFGGGKGLLSAAATKEPGCDTFIQDPYELRLGWCSLRFVDPSLEKKWENESMEDKLRIGARTMACVVGFLILGRILRLQQVLSTACLHPVNWAFVACNHLALFPLLGALVMCSRSPSHMIYWPALFFIFFYLPASGLPPWSTSCYELKTACHSESSWWMVQAYRHVDCSLQGHTSMQMLMTWILLQPWLIPRLDFMHGIWLWIFGVYTGWTIAYRQVTGEVVYDTPEICYRVFILGVTLLVALYKKYFLEKGQRLRYAEDIQQRETTFKLFSFLDVMMPSHVIKDMLQDPPPTIAAEVDRVSILFVFIDNFDHFARTKTPQELLAFLNQQFGQFDEICRRHNVTKIETVGEEYVACVGVLPVDIEEQKEESKKSDPKTAHGTLLTRMFSAAGEMLRCQTDDVRYKMGVHTGPIVAGVIGTKLPRYRLFGDTINSAARMMQKGEPGELTFGEETRDNLTESLKAQIRGPKEVEQKGKGKVKAYTYVPGANKGAMREVSNDPHAASAGTGDQKPKARKSLGAALRAYPTLHASPLMAKVLGHAGSLMDMRKAQEEVHDKEADDRFQKLLKDLEEEPENRDHQAHEEWMAWFHRETIILHAGRRFGTKALLLMILTGSELACLIHWKIWMYPHALYSKRFRWPVFVYSRGFVIFITMLWWYAVESFEWVKTNPRKAQTLLLTTTCMTMVLMFISYDALVFSDNESYRKYVQFTVNFRAPVDQTLTLNFVLFFYLAMRMHALLFLPSLVFLPVAIVCVLVHNMYQLMHHRASHEITWEDIFSYQGEFLIIVQTVMNIAVAYEDEQTSRSRFKAQQVVKKMENRTGSILGTLMPPLVVKQLRHLSPNDPQPSHKYRHATIAQSDLCGFTQLSSTKKPTEVVRFMGELFGAFDVLTDKWKVYKVETIGDAYIAGMAEPPLTELNLPVNVVLFGLDMVRAVDDWARHLGVKVTCRVGIHYGECIGGIVGNEMQRYHLFGDSLTCMDTLEATSVEGRVQVSPACRAEVMRQLKDDPGASPEKLEFVLREANPKVEGSAEECMRTGLYLRTSKGEIHKYEEVGGHPYLVESDHPLRRN